MNYLIAFHLIAVVCWFAGLFYLPRLFVYHASTNDVSVKNQFKIMEHKLYFYIMMPSMILTILSGMVLFTLYVFAAHPMMGWLVVKLFLVMLLVIYHFFCGHCLELFRRDANSYSGRFYRILNEVPTVLLIAIMILAVVQPF